MTYNESRERRVAQKKAGRCRTNKRGRASRQAGFTLLLAALVSSIVLALGSSIFAIAQKQLTLSSIGRDSQFAFYAADTAAECALFWDFRYNYFATTTPSGVSPTCDGQALTPFDIQPSASQPYSYPYTLISQKVDLFLDASLASDYCAQVTITKTKSQTTNAVETAIHADGYSTSCDTISTNSRALQRSVELHY
ncbi:hypothetical protein HY418_00125 [Candidatus Kaiserbacteria bacterium]|nr:hypothetical protein [Candidatus Kaiserbacteria bacterium]